MRRQRARSLPVTGLAVVLALGMFSSASSAEDPCTAFKWNIAHERATFAQAPQSLKAAAAAEAAAQLLPERLYALSLVPQEQLQLAVPLGKKAQFAAAFGGLIRLRVAAAGTYHISLDQSGWIDVVGATGVINSSDYAGVPGCRTPHKSVQFNLPSGDYVLQLSGVSNASAQLAVTVAPD